MARCKILDRALREASGTWMNGGGHGTPQPAPVGRFELPTAARGRNRHLAISTWSQAVTPKRVQHGDRHAGDDRP
jgi:hypothetical protein